MPVNDPVNTYISRVVGQTLNGVYNSLGRKIGYFTDDAQLARGQIKLFAGETIVPATQWIVKSYGVDTSAAKYLIRRGLQPSWLSPAEAHEVKVKTDTGLIPPLNLSFALPDLGNPFFQATGGGTKLGTYVVWGGVGLLALLVFTKRR